MNRVFILGAGFSKAVNDVMPVLSELTNGVTSTLRGWGVEVGEDLEAIADVEQCLRALGGRSRHDRVKFGVCVPGLG